MTLLSKVRTSVLKFSSRSFCRTTPVLGRSKEDLEFDEEKFLQEEKPWEVYTPKYGIGMMPDPRPYIDAYCDEPHGLKLIPVFWCGVVFLLIPLSIYAWYNEYQHLVVHRKRRPAPKHEFLHASGPRPLPWGDGKHGLMFHPYWNFLPEGYETDKDGNKLPPGVYVQE